MNLLYRRDIRRIKIITSYPGPGADVLMCTFQAVNIYYYKYNVWGMNVVLVNLLPFVLSALFFAYFPYLVPAAKLPDGLMFTLCLFAVIPLSYFIGLALSSLSAQVRDLYRLLSLFSLAFGLTLTPTLTLTLTLTFTH